MLPVDSKWLCTVVQMDTIVSNNHKFPYSNWMTNCDSDSDTDTGSVVQRANITASICGAE